jgi:hypothetical protein
MNELNEKDLRKKSKDDLIQQLMSLNYQYRCLEDQSQDGRKMRDQLRDDLSTQKEKVHKLENQKVEASENEKIGAAYRTLANLGSERHIMMTPWGPMGARW